MEYADREHQAAQYIIEDLAAQVEREKSELNDKKKKQMKTIIEKAKQDNKSLDWATIVLC